MKKLNKSLFKKAKIMKFKEKLKLISELFSIWKMRSRIHNRKKIVNKNNKTKIVNL